MKTRAKRKNKLLPAIALILGITILASTFISNTVLKASANTVPSLTLTSKSAALIDFDTGTVVYAKNEKNHLPIASMTKITTLGIIFDEISAKNLKLDDQIVVTQNAASMGGSQAFLDANSAYSVSDLLKTIIVASANDSCVAFAEHLYGSVEAFVSKMNSYAADIGCNDTNFVNCTGLPAANQYSCAYDVALLMRKLASSPIYYEFAKVWMFDLKHPSGRVTQLSNTNKLLRSFNGCDGGKTGFTNEAMHCLAATAKRNNTRFISVVIASPDSKTRFSESSALLSHGFSNYETKQVVFKDKALDIQVNVKNGKQKTITVAPNSDLFYFTSKNDKTEPKLQIDINQNITAPVAESDVVGKITVIANEKTQAECAVVSLNQVNKRTYGDILSDLITEW